MDDQERFKRIEEAILMMKDLLVSHEEKFDRHDDKLSDFYAALEESRKDFEFKLNALIDSQIRNEADMTKLKSASESHLQRIEKIENN